MEIPSSKRKSNILAEALRSMFASTFLSFVLLGVHVFNSNTTGIVRLTSIILQKKILKNPVFKSTISKSLHPDF
jgi:hypothetical protein